MCCLLWPVDSISMQIFPVSAGITDRFLSARLLLHSCPLSPSHPRLPPHSPSWPHTAPPPLRCTRAAPCSLHSHPHTHWVWIEVKNCHASSNVRRSFWIRLPWMWRNFFFSLEGSRMLFRLVNCFSASSEVWCVWPVHPKLRVTNVLPFTCASSPAVWLSVHHGCEFILPWRHLDIKA